MLFTKIENVIRSIDLESIPSERKKVLQPLIDFIQTKVDDQQEVRLHFICTHNSRRSHLAQVWAQVMSYYFRIKNVQCYSGGSEETALLPMIIETLRQNGFKIESQSSGNNPVYSINYAENVGPVIGFSKRYNDGFNPKDQFAAIMTCSQADADCPFIAGAEKRIPITYEDPKVYDNTSLQTQKYKERSLQIASEMLYVFSQIRS